MKRNTIIILSLTSLFVFFGCTKELNIETETTLPDENTALSDFAEILSSAVYSELPLRDFIKSEALKEFDRDYDVFYPFVKDEIVYDNQTFRQILEKYDTKGLLQEIEAREPLLNILVPDWSWVDEECFSVHHWDTSNPEVAVTYACPGPTVPLYGKGELLGSMRGNEFSSEPVLVVKRNERMVFNPTKSGPLVYDFSNPAYDGSRKIETKGTWYNHIYDFDAVYPSYAVPLSVLPEKVRNAYYESENNSSMFQRDGIYYNMTAVRDTGIVDFHYAESLLRFRFANANMDALSDDPESGNQMTLNEIAYQYGSGISEDALKQYGWLDGKFEMVINIKAGDCLIEKVLPSMNISDAFAVDKLHFQWYQNIFNTVTYRRYWVEKEELVPQWINLNEELFTWDLSDFPLKYIVEFKEKDSGATTVQGGSQTFQYATNFNVSGEAGIDKIKIGFGAGASSQSSRSSSWSVTVQDGDDNLGSAYVQYINPVVTNVVGNNATLKTYSTSSILFQVLPKKVY